MPLLSRVSLQSLCPPAAGAGLQSHHARLQLLPGSSAVQEGPMLGWRWGQMKRRVKVFVSSTSCSSPHKPQEARFQAPLGTDKHVLCLFRVT